MEAESDEGPTAIAAFEEEFARCRAHEQEFVGLSEQEARDLAAQLGLQLRVRYSDDDALTADLRASRMTVEVREGRVAQAYGG